MSATQPTLTIVTHAHTQCRLCSCAASLSPCTTVTQKLQLTQPTPALSHSRAPWLRQGVTHDTIEEGMRRHVLYGAGPLKDKLSLTPYNLLDRIAP